MIERSRFTAVVTNACRPRGNPRDTFAPSVALALRGFVNPWTTETPAATDPLSTLAGRRCTVGAVLAATLRRLAACLTTWVAVASDAARVAERNLPALRAADVVTPADRLRACPLVTLGVRVPETAIPFAVDRPSAGDVVSAPVATLPIWRTWPAAVASDAVSVTRRARSATRAGLTVTVTTSDLDGALATAGPAVTPTAVTLPT